MLNSSTYQMSRFRPTLNPATMPKDSRPIFSHCGMDYLTLSGGKEMRHPQGVSLITQSQMMVSGFMNIVKRTIFGFPRCLARASARASFAISSKHQSLMTSWVNPTPVTWPHGNSMGTVNSCLPETNRPFTTQLLFDVAIPNYPASLPACQARRGGLCPA